MRQGFTLIEAVVALVLFQIAALALAASIAVAARDMAAATRHGRASVLARERVERLRAAACHGGSTGTARHPDGLEEHWVTTGSGRTRRLKDSVAFAAAGRSVFVVAEGWELCR